MSSKFAYASLPKNFKNILVVVKETPYEQYMQQKAQGKAPVAIRWERLKDRFSVHKKCVDDVIDILNSNGISYSMIRRDELHRGRIVDKDLVISVGGDGTVLNTSSFIDDTIPLLGVNSDPTRPEEQGVSNLVDERRSRGALCAITASNVHSLLPKVLVGEIPYSERSRIQCFVRSMYTETRLPPSLNDILVSHPNPAAISRFRLSHCVGHVSPSFKTTTKLEELFSFNVWSSGIWISSATGSTAAMLSAGGYPMDINSSDLQYMVREHLVEPGKPFQKRAGHEIIRSGEMLHINWNSQHGCVYADGAHMKHALELGDEVKIDGNAPRLKIFNPL